MRAAVRTELEKHAVLRDFAHDAGVEALASSAEMAGRGASAVVDAIRHMAVKATAGAWARSRIEGALARAVQYAREPENPRESERDTLPQKPRAKIVTPDLLYKTPEIDIDH